MLNRRLLAGLLLLALNGPIVVAVASGAAAGSCSMCARACCCLPRTGSGATCRIERPCGQDSAPQTPVLSLLEKPALVAVAGAMRPPSGAGLASREAAPRIFDAARTPPYPPPRLSLQQA